MTGMEHAIEQVRQAMQDAMNTYGPFSGTDQARHIYDYLHALGLIAPAPLREEWGSEVRDVRPDRDPYVLWAIDLDNAQWQIEHNPDWATGRIMHRYRTDWLPVDRAE